MLHASREAVLNGVLDPAYAGNVVGRKPRQDSPTRRSLIVLDELGWGTSTYNGLALAYAVLEYLHEQPELGARTLFATHFHELTRLADRYRRVRNYHVAVAEAGDHVVFLREIVPGPAERSFGIHVARMAGIPECVVQRAAEVLAALERRGARAATCGAGAGCHSERGCAGGGDEPYRQGDRSAGDDPALLRGDRAAGHRGCGRHDAAPGTCAGAGA